MKNNKILHLVFALSLAAIAVYTLINIKQTKDKHYEQQALSESNSQPKALTEKAEAMTHKFKEVTIYSTRTCPYCVNAKKLLDKKGVPYSEINIDANYGLIQEMIERSGGKRTVPQIFVGETHVGGFDDMAALESKGKLDELLRDNS